MLGPGLLPQRSNRDCASPGISLPHPEVPVTLPHPASPNFTLQNTCWATVGLQLDGAGLRDDWIVAGFCRVVGGLACLRTQITLTSKAAVTHQGSIRGHLNLQCEAPIVTDIFLRSSSTDDIRDADITVTYNSSKTTRIVTNVSEVTIKSTKSPMSPMSPKSP